MKPEETISVNVKRIRVSRGMSQVDVAKATSISRQAYIDIENGKTKEPRISSLQAIADTFSVHITDLFIEPPELKTVRFRNNSIKTAKDKARKQQYLIDAACWLKDFNFLQAIVGDKKEYRLQSISAKISEFNDSVPIKAAEIAREYLGLDDNEPINDIIGLVESAGIKIRTKSFDLKNFFGFSISDADGGPAIMVNVDNNITIERQIFTVAHELGHLLLHPNAYDSAQTAENKDEEKEADSFAGYFLMPQRAFKKKLDESYGLGFIERVFHIKRFFGVSYQAVLHRLADMGIADYGKLTAKFRAIYKAKHHKSIPARKEPFPLSKLDFVEDYFILLIRKALDKDQITVSRAAEILNVPIKGMREIINSWSDLAA